jgi:hypothetical protein
MPARFLQREQHRTCRRFTVQQPNAAAGCHDRKPARQFLGEPGHSFENAAGEYEREALAYQIETPPYGDCG